MTTCPRCQAKNQNSSRFCRACGAELSGSSLRDKKRKVLEEKRGSRRSTALGIGLAVILGSLVLWFIRGSSGVDPRISGQPRIDAGSADPRTVVSMAEVSASLEDGRIVVPLDLVRTKRFVRFGYTSASGPVPLLAYIAPSGRIVTAISVCEPCRSTRFTIRDRSIVCNTCETEWNIENLKGIRGGCVDYPPEIVPSTVDGNRILIDESNVARWKPRA